MKRTASLLIVAALCASAALAHTGVQNPAVKARMHGMEDLARATKTLGRIAKGEAAFDPETVAASLDDIKDHAAAIPGLFETPAQDPKSEARGVIWTNWDDFVERSDALVAAAATARVGGPDDLRAALDRIGGACKSCHENYRE